MMVMPFLNKSSRFFSLQHYPRANRGVIITWYITLFTVIGSTLFFLGEYANMLLMSALMSILFLGGWLPPFNENYLPQIPGSFWFSLKMLLGVSYFIVTRATLPRYRYDQLMHIGWKCFLPLTIGYLFFTTGILVSFNWLPN